MKNKVFFACFAAVILLSFACLAYAQPPAGPGGGRAMGYGDPYDYPPSRPWGMGYGRHHGPRMGPHMYGRGYSTPEGGGWFCPWCGQELPPQERYYDPSYDRRAYGGGLGMMPHYGWAPRYMPPRYPNAKWWGKGLSKEDAQTLLNKELGINKNPNLKWGKITEHENYWEAELLTKNDELVDKVQVHKYTGWFRSAYDAEE